MNETPLMLQYREMKKQYSDMVLFFRLGDFYEMFDEDAKEVSALLNLTLTHRGDSPMCGIPYHAAKNYIKRLLDCGKKIAICEQLELSENSKSLAKREVVRIVTPATVVEDDFLEDSVFSWIMAVFQHTCSYCDVSTGEFHLRQLPKDDRIQSIRCILEQLHPKEILVCEDEYFLDKSFKEAVDNARAMVTKLPPWYFNVKSSYTLMCQQAKVNSLASYGIENSNKAVGTAGALLRYVQETSKSSVAHLTDYKVDLDDMYLSMDESSRKNLELFNNLYDGSSRYSLCDTINRCRTSSGTRLLKSWISFPLKDISLIQFRQNWVQFFYDNPEELKRVRESIVNGLDMNRLTTRILMKKSVPHDLCAIAQSIGTFFDLTSKDFEKYATLFETTLKIPENLQAAAELMKEIDSAINNQFLGQFNSGEVIVDGYDEELDQRRSLKQNSDAVLKQYLEEEKQATGISILKLGYNRVFGYYLEVPKGQVSKAPDYFLRKQTLVNGERFTTKKLQDFEVEIMKAGSLAEQRELELYNLITDQVASLVPVLNSIGHFTSLLDVFQGLAQLAVDSSYVCPLMTEDDVLEIKDGRHPVVEKQLGPGMFTANDLDMNCRFALITGPNMAGKSTFLRQNALIILLAHIGSFVPASQAKIGITDKIFCRVGASDNLARGESTFLLEMQEAAFILRTCTKRSFVIVDEIGRGTSTQDGMSIAYAVMKDLIAKDVKTLFATHYHELTMMDVQGIKLLTLEVQEENGDVRFLRHVIDGVANSSYGIHVARLAGVPSSVIKQAKNFQNKHFADYTMNQTSLFTRDSADDGEEDCGPGRYAAIIDSLRQVDPDQLTPVQAMVYLSGLKEELKKTEC